MKWRKKTKNGWQRNTKFEKEEVRKRMKWKRSAQREREGEREERKVKKRDSKEEWVVINELENVVKERRNMKKSSDKAEEKWLEKRK